MLPGYINIYIIVIFGQSKVGTESVKSETDVNKYFNSMYLAVTKLVSFGDCPSKNT